MVNQCTLDREHAPVHHVARSDAVCACADVVERDLGDALGGGRRVDRPILAEVSTVSVRCVFAETDVRGDVQRREELAECFDGEDHWALGVVCGRPYVVLGEHVALQRYVVEGEQVGFAHLDAFCRHAEENDALQPILHERVKKFTELVDAPAALIWEGWNRFGCVLDIGDEDGVHQHRLCEVTSGLP